ncbi:LPXTG cell wall anchor domain-containing protein [Enterococcus sp. 669A]|uniref:LPXTG cell wall anchor domain-containing protein n=1 Tax=Candidatus Enterococcus moelleringii TaxID=2815325 RepID=A0ABS3LGK0_9ENTE|nr:LPXTG cell wall anchor domain-containing protein [Enterococcus sp. 669A]MBO1308762.1 LPXTG cell wall anchor domain-containing protein [Enterococcus sp. 669A]
MKKTRMMRYEKKMLQQNKRNRRFYQVTTVMTLICPMVLGTVSALAEETAPEQATTATTAGLADNILPSAEPAPFESVAPQELVETEQPEAAEVPVVEEIPAEVTTDETEASTALPEETETQATTVPQPEVQAQASDPSPEEETEESAAKIETVSVVIHCTDNKNNVLKEETVSVPVNESRVFTAPEIAGYKFYYTYPAIDDPNSMVTTDYQNKNYVVSPAGVGTTQPIHLQFGYRKIISKNYSATFRTSEAEAFVNVDGESYWFDVIDETGWNVGSISCRFPSTESNEFKWTAWDYDANYSIEGSGGQSGVPISYEIDGAKYTVTVIVDQRVPVSYSTISFAVEGNGTLSDAGSIEKRNGYYLTAQELPTANAAPGYHFVGWRVSDQDWFSYGMSIGQDITITAVFEAGDLDWSKYDAYLANYEAYVQLKDVYEHFNLFSDWEAWNTIYQTYVDFRNRTGMSQKEIDREAAPLSGMNLNYIDHYFMFGVKIEERIRDVFDSLQAVYRDTTSYTSDSKQNFNDAYLKINDLFEQQELQNGVYERELFNAYQEMVDARTQLVRNDGTKTLTGINLVPIKGFSYDGELQPFSNFMIQHSYSDGTHEDLLLNKNDYIISTGNENDVITDEGIIFNGVGERSISVIYDSYQTSCVYSVNDIPTPAEDFTKAKEALELFNALNKADYTPESWEEMLDMLAATSVDGIPANEVLQEMVDGTHPAEFHQSDVDWMTAAVNMAMNSLVKKDTGGNNGNGGNTGDGGNSGNEGGNGAGNNGSGNNDGSDNGNNSGANNNDGGSGKDDGANDKTDPADTTNPKGNANTTDQNAAKPTNTNAGSTKDEVKTVNKYSQANTQGTTQGTATDAKGLPQTGEKGSFILTLVGMSTLGVALTGAFLKSRKKFE